MSKRMDSHALVIQGGTPGPGGGQMLGQEVVEAVVAERTAALIGEQRVVRFATAFPQPCPQRCRRVLAQRRTPLLSSLAVAAHMGAGAKLDVLAAQTDEFRGPQSGLHRHQQQDAVAPSRAGLRVRRPEQNVDLVAFEKGDGASGVAFVRNGQNPLGQRGVAGLMQGDEAEERTDGGRSSCLLICDRSSSSTNAPPRSSTAGAFSWRWWLTISASRCDLPTPAGPVSSTALALAMRQRSEDNASSMSCSV